MKRIIILMGMLLACSGCATIPRTVDYVDTEWKEVEEEVSEVVQVVQDVPKNFPQPKPGRKYHKLGGPNARNPNRVPKPGEMRLILPQDAYAEIDDRTDKVWKDAWLRAGEPVFGVATDDPTVYKVMWVEKCGNNVRNPESIAILIRVRREVVSHKTTKQWKQFPVKKTRALTCHERKQLVPWYQKIPQYLLAAGGGFIGAKFGDKLGAGIGAGSGRIIGGLFDGTWCFDGGDMTESAIIAVTAYSAASSGAATNTTPTAHPGGSSTPPPMGPTGPSPLPPLGPTGPAPLPVM